MKYTAIKYLMIMSVILRTLFLGVLLPLASFFFLTSLSSSVLSSMIDGLEKKENILNFELVLLIVDRYNKKYSYKYLMITSVILRTSFLEFYCLLMLFSF